MTDDVEEADRFRDSRATSRPWRGSPLRHRRRASTHRGSVSGKNPPARLRSSRSPCLEHKIQYCILHMARASAIAFDRHGIPGRMAPRKIIIDTDPGQDDAFAILFALGSPAELEVVGDHHGRRQRAARPDGEECAEGGRARRASGHPGLCRLPGADGPQADHGGICAWRNRPRRRRPAGAGHAAAGRACGQLPRRARSWRRRKAA